MKLKTIFYKNIRFVYLLFLIINISCNMDNGIEHLYVGTFCEQEDNGIYVFEFDRKQGSVRQIQAINGFESPSYLEIHPSGEFLYSVNRSSVTENENWGSVSSFQIDSHSGQIRHMNSQPAQGGESCHLALDSEGRMVFIANYNQGNIAAFPVLNNGTLAEASEVRQHMGSGPNRERQEGPHAHCVAVSANDRWLYAVDLGIDRIKVYEIDYENSQLIDLPAGDGISKPGSGPRHIALHPTINKAYVIEELASSITSYDLDPVSGALTPDQTVPTIPETFNDTNYCADIHIHPNGKLLYASNRGHDSLAIYRINENTGELTFIAYQTVFGKWPRNFLIDPEGDFIFVVNQNSDNLVIFLVNPETGLLKRTNQEINIPNPVCVKIR